MYGSEANDPYYLDGGQIRTKTNHAGGINGGITNGMPLILTAVFRPTPSIAKPQQTINLVTGQPTEFTITGRHDPCIVPVSYTHLKWSPKVVGRVSRVCGIVVAFLILTLVGYLLVQMVLPQLTESIKTVTMNLPTYYTNAESWLRQIFHDNIQLKGYVDQIVAEVYSQLTVWPVSYTHLAPVLQFCITMLAWSSRRW